MRISDWSSDVCSSDLRPGDACAAERIGAWRRQVDTNPLRCDGARPQHEEAVLPLLDAAMIFAKDFGAFRSEEHTSELQSLMRISYAVFCLKKKNIIKIMLKSIDEISNITKRVM